MPEPQLWFSHRENRFAVKKRWIIAGKPQFSWTNSVETWDWDHCTVSLARTLDNRLLAVVRSSTNRNSRYMGDKPVELRFMLGFEVKTLTPPKSETYTARKNLDDPDKVEGPKERWVFRLGDDYWLWDWVEGGKISSSYVNELYEKIKQELESPSIKGENIFEPGVTAPGDGIIPVIYQPAVDSLDNFIREVHCASSGRADGKLEVEVTVIFNNEQLRRHAFGGVLDRIYLEFRRLFYGRTFDIESFRILGHLDKGDNFTFENIYGQEHTLEDDSIHGDPPTAPQHAIKYYFGDQRHPVVFVNTSNHAFAEHDTNHRLWKWEYLPWAEKASIKFGSETREEINRRFKSKLKFW